MKPRRLLIALALLPAALLAASAPAFAAPAPAWQLHLYPVPAAFPPAGEGEYEFAATNVGAAPAAPGAQLSVSLPSGLRPTSVGFPSVSNLRTVEPPECEISGQTLACLTTEALAPGYALSLNLKVAVEASGGSPLATAAISGGGAPQAATATAVTPISAAPLGFGITSFTAFATNPEGTPATLAGSHPGQLTLDMLFPAVRTDAEHLTGSGHLRDAFAELPRGVAVDPAATPLRCTEAQLILDASGGGCPLESQIGVVSVTSSLAAFANLDIAPLYNMVPPPGTPASFGFDAVGVGIYIHILSGVRSDSDFGLYGTSEDVLALTSHSLLGFQAQLWGDPLAASHDTIRGHKCPLFYGGESCPPKARGEVPALILPAACSASAPAFALRADSWEQPGAFQSATSLLADSEGSPTPLDGCNAEPFEPQLSSQPTTNLTDSPTGLDFDLHQPQDQKLGHIAPASLKDAIVTLPAGMVANPSQADGLEACTQEQIGYLGEGHYSKQPDSCPNASKIGTVEVASPLLAQYNAQNEVETDPETGEPIPEPLKGSLYLAKPFENQFGSLLALYISIDDQKHGIVAKLAGQVIPDPVTGQLTTTFSENPELPIEDVRLHLFGGARASLISPPVCGTHTTTSDLVPWSTPEGKDAHPSDSFATTASPAGGCPTSEGTMPNSPSLTAGTVSPKAGAYTPFVLKLARKDGSQRLRGFDATLPPGLTGKLAGVAECSDAQIAQAQSRSNPDEGQVERDHPSCPASSEVGIVHAGAGAGPTPFYATGHAYLAGPYKGAPLSLAIITPAIAGPFDLGTVVVRTALHVDPETAQIHAVSDPFPTILDGIPLDLRTVSLEMGRPEFTLNPTSCDPMQIIGTSLSALGQAASLSNPFQVGGCSSLPFKPKLSLKLKGGTRRTSHPRLIATLKAKPGEANIAEAQVKLPPSAFLDQAHIRTVCTRVQFAADACPQGSIYGKAEATTPLLSYPLKGDVYLRSSDHKLPDLVVALKGPDYQPIEIDLDGRTDSVRGALRNTFEAVPDAPVSTFRLELLGGKRGLVINSRDLCAHRYRAEVNLTGQSGKVFDTTPVVGTDCKRKKGHKRHGRHK